MADHTDYLLKQMSIMGKMALYDSFPHLQYDYINDISMHAYIHTGESIRLDVVTSGRDESNEVRSLVRELSEENKLTR